MPQDEDFLPKVRRRFAAEWAFTAARLMSATRTFPTLSFSYAADAAYVCSCSGTLLATHRFSPQRPLRGSKSGLPKPPFRCPRVKQSGRGTKRPFAVAVIADTACARNRSEDLKAVWRCSTKQPFKRGNHAGFQSDLSLHLDKGPLRRCCRRCKLASLGWLQINPTITIRSHICGLLTPFGPMTSALREWVFDPRPRA